MDPFSLDVELFGHLAVDHPRRQTLALDRPLSAGEIAALLHLPAQEIGLIILNGQQIEPEDPICNSGRLCFFPPLSGG